MTSQEKHAHTRKSNRWPGIFPQRFQGYDKYTVFHKVCVLENALIVNLSSKIVRACFTHTSNTASKQKKLEARGTYHHLGRRREK
jgi:hypothetical protein